VCIPKPYERATIKLISPLSLHSFTQLIFKRSGMAPPGAQQQGGAGPPKEVKFIPTATGGAFN
jgi:hypothetical protein